MGIYPGFHSLCAGALTTRPHLLDIEKLYNDKIYDPFRVSLPDKNTSNLFYYLKTNATQIWIGFVILNLVFAKKCVNPAIPISPPFKFVEYYTSVSFFDALFSVHPFQNYSS